MRILVSNDDGIEAPGLSILSEALSGLGEVFIVAPDRERSAAAHSLTIHRPLRIYPRGPRRFAVDGTPTDCVNLGVLEIMKDEPPALVVSGINAGPNLGDDITYSGTVCAAMEGGLLGIPSIAISLTVRNGETPNFLPAGNFARRIARKVLSTKFPADLILNVNVPNIEGDQVDDFEITVMGKRRYGSAIEEKIDPRGRKYYWVGGEELSFEDIPGSDCHAIFQNKVSITPIRLDITHGSYLDILKAWKL